MPSHCQSNIKVKNLDKIAFINSTGIAVREVVGVAYKVRECHTSTQDLHPVCDEVVTNSTLVKVRKRYLMFVKQPQHWTYMIHLAKTREQYGFSSILKGNQFVKYRQYVMVRICVHGREF